MTLLALLNAAFRKVDRYFDERYTYESMEHMDERLLRDIGVCRQGNRIVAMPVHTETPVTETRPACPALEEQCCLLQESGG